VRSRVNRHATDRPPFIAPAHPTPPCPTPPAPTSNRSSSTAHTPPQSRTCSSWSRKTAGFAQIRAHRHPHQPRRPHPPQRHPRRSLHLERLRVPPVPCIWGPGLTNPSIRNPSARCVSSSTGDPTRSSPTIARSRASVTSSREGSGVCGANNPSCTLLCAPASAAQREPNHRRLRRMRSNLQLQQLEQKFPVDRRHRRPDRANAVRPSALQSHLHRQRAQRQRPPAPAQPGNRSSARPQRAGNRSAPPASRTRKTPPAKTRARSARNVCSRSPRASARHTRAFGPIRATSSCLRQRRQLAQRANAPQRKGRRVLFIQPQEPQSAASPAPPPPRPRNHRDPAHARRLHPRRVEICAHRNRRAKPRPASSSLSRSANCAGGPNSRSVPAMSSTKAHAVPLPTSIVPASFNPAPHTSS
jgi:hypothetical protein